MELAVRLERFRWGRGDCYLLVDEPPLALQKDPKPRFASGPWCAGLQGRGWCVSLVTVLERKKLACDSEHDLQSICRSLGSSFFVIFG
jgi:hypothetical protein